MLLLYLLPDAGAQGWEWVNPKPQGSNLHSVQFVNQTTGYAVGDFGVILKTTDGGTSWSIQSSGISSNLYGLFFTEENTGTAIGGSGTILRTADGGSTWTVAHPTVSGDVGAGVTTGSKTITWNAGADFSGQQKK